MNTNIINFKNISDNRGNLVSLEEMRNIPFEIKRIYYIYNNKGNEVRGKHAHKNLKQVAICLNGSCTFLLDGGKYKKEFMLNKPNQGLFIDKMTWREMYNFSKNCVIMVIANDYYDEKDYIKNYNEFLIEVKNE